jgi:preprotein translocase subunit SecG
MNSMILAASGLTIAINLLLVILVAVCLLLCLVVLMQRPKQEGLGAAFGGGMTDQAFGARTTDVLQKGTVYLGTAFFLVTLSLSILVVAQNSGQNIEQEVVEAAEEQVSNEETVEEVAAIVEETIVEEAEIASEEAELEVPEVESEPVASESTEDTPAK